MNLLDEIITKNNVVDWVELGFTALTAVGTITALFIAIRSSKETAKFSRDTLEESRENRKDDVMPILQMTKGEQTGTDFRRINLKNVGQGPLFDFKIASPRQGVEYITEVNSDGDVIYRVLARTEEVLKGKKEAWITYTYKDMYGRSFRTRQRVFLQNDSLVDFDKQIEIPKKILEKS